MDRKPRVIVVGGRPRHIPDEFREYFDVVKHLSVTDTKTTRFGQLPRADYVFSISNFVSHNMMEAAKSKTGHKPIHLNKGWNSMKAELERRGLIRLQPQ